MSKPFPNTPELRRSTGFTLIELLVAMTLTLILLGMAFYLFNQLNDTADVVGTIGDVNQNLRAAVNLIARDVSTAGAEIPVGGIPLPGGGSSSAAATPVNMPGPGGRVFNPGAGGFMAVITPGSGVGPQTAPGAIPPAIPTDVITMITIDPLSLLNQTPLTSVSFTATSATITLDPGTNLASGVSQVVSGQLIMLQNSNSSCILTVSAVNTSGSPPANTITFTAGDANDVLGLNQFPNPPNGPTTGTIGQLQTAGTPPTWPSTTAYHLKMITYYLDTSNPQRLIRLVGSGVVQPPQPVAIGINVLQFSYDCYSAAGVVTANARTGINPNQIRSVSLWLIAKADHRARISRQYYSNSIATAVTAQNLAYFNKY